MKSQNITMQEIKPKRGGKRQGAGRPKNSGYYGEQTKSVRVPISLVQEVKDFVLLRLLMKPIKKEK